MDPLDFLEPEELLRFFHCHKTELSVMENPHTFLSQLRDHDLIPDDTYEKVSRMKSKDNIKRTLYEVLDCLERELPQYIKVFWRSVFKETIMNYYPTLRLLRNRLMDGSYSSDIQLPEKVQRKEADEGNRKEPSEDEEGEEKKVKKKRKLRRRSVCDDEEAGPSCPVTPCQRKKSNNLHFSSPLKKGEKVNLWTWPFYKSQLLVTCGDQKGTLNRDRLAKGEKCIVVDKQWFTPTEFERFAGKHSCKNWKWSIRCMDTPLGKLIEEGHLKSAGYKRGSTKAKKPLFPPGHVLTVSEGDEDEDEDSDLDKEDQVSSSSKESPTDEEGEMEQQPDTSHDSGKKVFEVTCRALAGTLHKKRFASGTCGKSIRTETGWMTPVEFMTEASCQTDASWRREIKCEGEPLSVLTEANILEIHSLLCSCRLCKPDQTDLKSQENDDECCICKSEEEEELVVCDHCPRSFHQKCHLPHLDDTILGDSSLWMCTFCVFKSNQECYYRDKLNRKAAMTREISQHILECQYLLLCLRSADEEQTFATDPRCYLNDYSTVIKTPMWLGKVADKLQKQLYKAVGGFESDVQLIFTNCASYNRDNAEFLAKGNRLKELFDGELKNVFNIHE